MMMGATSFPVKKDLNYNFLQQWKRKKKKKNSFATISSDTTPNATFLKPHYANKFNKLKII